MAVRYFLSAPTLILNSSSSEREKPSHRLFVHASNSKISINNNTITTTFNHLGTRSASNIKLKVFEDRSKGIVCYKDENGEITCEGYDEGPRFSQQFPSFSYRSRDREIIELLERCCFHMADAADQFNPAE
ncbi:PREDICTED: uncharacterized protein LOC109229050 [Nicotiana attenuata]|uniref:Uncharacterized protein n=1 Tax=Nicotiana attenuata TaxID=49451 RepID=A0A1J6IJ87_NICAT|nr:PREDICTED: uncharacterized protein LOC109229050 [Nicotiana attenuata]OIT00576.1 hypothetical protein A4A49_15572 [Nicotiana attenuata]